MIGKSLGLSFIIFLIDLIDIVSEKDGEMRREEETETGTGFLYFLKIIKLNCSYLLLVFSKSAPQSHTCQVKSLLL